MTNYRSIIQKAIAPRAQSELEQAYHDPEADHNTFLNWLRDEIAINSPEENQRLLEEMKRVCGSVYVGYAEEFIGDPYSYNNQEQEKIRKKQKNKEIGLNKSRETRRKNKENNERIEREYGHQKPMPYGFHAQEKDTLERLISEASMKCTQCGYEAKTNADGVCDQCVGKAKAYRSIIVRKGQTHPFNQPAVKHYHGGVGHSHEMSDVGHTHSDGSVPEGEISSERPTTPEGESIYGKNSMNTPMSKKLEEAYQVVSNRPA